MRLLYYPGCTVKRNAIDYEKKGLAIIRKLGIEVEELADWYCCGALFSLAIDELAKHIGGLRTLIKAQEHSRKLGAITLLTLCPMCYNVLKRINNMLTSRPENLETLSLFMDEEERYRVSVDVIHLLNILNDNINKLKSAVVKDMKEFKVVSYYGCTLLRPKEVAIDNAENPTIMDNVLQALGATVIEFPLRSECCGSYQVAVNRDVVKTKSLEIIDEALALDANTIAVVCPLCYYNLNIALKESKAKLNIVYITDLISYALGLEV